MESIEDAAIVQQWTSEVVAQQIARYLRVNNYSEKFMRNAIDGDELLHLSREDLAVLGVTAIGHLNKLSRWVERLKNQSTQVTTRHLAPAKAEDLQGETGASITKDATNEAVGSPKGHSARKVEILEVTVPSLHEEQKLATNRATKYEEALSSQTMELDLIQKFVVRGMEEQLRDSKAKTDKATVSSAKVKEVMDFQVKEDGLKVQEMEADIFSLQEELRVAKNRATKYEEALSSQSKELDSRVGSHNFVASCMEEQLSDVKGKTDKATLSLAEEKKAMDFQIKEYGMKVQGLVANIFSLQEELRFAKNRTIKYEEALRSQTNELDSRVGSHNYVVSCLEEQLSDAKGKTDKATLSLAEAKKAMDFQIKEYGMKVQRLEATIFSLQEELRVAMNRANKYEEALSFQAKELDSKVGSQKFVLSSTEEQLRGARGKPTRPVP